MDRSHYTAGACVAAALLLIQLGACAPKTTPASPAPSGTPSAEPSNENLHAVLWAQTSAEYKAAAEQAYLLAGIRLSEALADTKWTAAIEQDGDFSARPPAVILDVDETVLDNSAYQARLVKTNGEYSEDTWQPWAREMKAIPIPGALRFTQDAAARGVTVFYITNRQHTIEEPTRANLQKYGFPLDPARDTILTQNERPDWSSSDKSPRRRAVADQFRVLLEIGDDMGDFVTARHPLERRLELYRQYDSYWGRRWIVLPNPSYGSWEGALFGYEYGLSRPDKLRRKGTFLETGQQ
jgi:acid phosphatase